MSAIRGRSPNRRDDWRTPRELFKRLDEEFRFELDAAADAGNALCPRWYGIEADGLSRPWAPCRTWVNPPYSQTARWVAKAVSEAARGALVVMLLPASTGTRWFHEHINGRAEVRFLPGRLTFEGAPWPAPFDSMIVVLRPLAATSRE